MTNKLFSHLSLVAILLACCGHGIAASYPTTSYKLSADGFTLEKWLGDESTVDLASDSRFSTVTTIGNDAFSARRDLREVVLSQGITTLRQGAFSDCNMLKAITFNDALKTIGNDAFRACKGLKTIDFKNVTAVGSTAFSGCNALVEVKIPRQLTQLGYATFYNCNRLKNFTVEDGNPAYSAIDGVLLDNKQETLIVYPRAKADTSYIVPTTVTSLEGRAFDGCRKLKTLEMGAHIATIGKNALFNCTGLNKIIIHATLPPLLQGDSPLKGINVATCRLHVPQSAIDAYRQAQLWQNFATILPIEETSSVTAINGTANFTMSVQENRLHINWTDTAWHHITIYDTAGHLLYRARETGSATISLDTHIAIVHIANYSGKVVTIH